MANRTREVCDLSLPLLRRINEGKFTKSGAAAMLEKLLGKPVRPQDITNWLARGIPPARIPAVARICGISTDQYYSEAGAKVTGAPSSPPEQLPDDELSLLRAYRSVSATHKMAAHNFLKATPKQVDMFTESILTQVFSTAVSDKKLGDTWTRPDKK